MSEHPDRDAASGRALAMITATLTAMGTGDDTDYDTLYDELRELSFPALFNTCLAACQWAALMLEATIRDALDALEDPRAADPRAVLEAAAAQLRHVALAGARVAESLPALEDPPDQEEAG